MPVPAVVRSTPSRFLNLKATLGQFVLTKLPPGQSAKSFSDLSSSSINLMYKILKKQFSFRHIAEISIGVHDALLPACHI